MIEIHVIYMLLFAAATGVALSVAILSWRHRTARGARSLTALMLGIAVWTAASAAYWSVPSFQQQIFWLKVMALGIWMLPIGFLTLAFEIAGMKRWLTVRRITLLSLLPFALAISAWLDRNRLFFSAFSILKLGPHTHYGFMRGPLYWALMVVSYTTMMVGFLIISRVNVQSSGFEKTRTAILMYGAIVPFVGSAIYQLRLNLFNDLDFGPLAFVFTGTLWLAALLGNRLPDLRPLARGALVEQMSDGVVVLNEEDRIEDANPTALEMLEADAAPVLDQPAHAIMGAMAGAILSLNHGEAGERRRATVPIGSGDDPRYIELEVTTLLIAPPPRRGESRALGRPS